MSVLVINPFLVQPAFPAPTNFTATPGDTSVLLSWFDTNGETGYTIERSTDNATWTASSTPAANANNATVTSLTNGVLYYFRLRANYAGGSSDWVTASATPTAPPPQLETPSSFAATYNGSSIDLSWSSVTHATEYLVEVNFNYGGWSSLGSTAMTEMWSVGSDAGFYQFRVLAQASGYTSSEWAETSISI
jgi:hypothetical protein